MRLLLLKGLAGSIVVRKEMDVICMSITVLRYTQQCQILPSEPNPTYLETLIVRALDEILFRSLTLA